MLARDISRRVSNEQALTVIKLSIFEKVEHLADIGMTTILDRLRANLRMPFERVDVSTDEAG